MKRTTLAVVSAVLALAIALALAPAITAKKPKKKPKAPPNTSISLATSQGQVGTLQFYPSHPTGGRNYLFAQVTVQLECESRIAADPVFTPSGSSLRTFFVAGTIAPGGGPRHLETLEVTGLPGNTSSRKLDVTLTPAVVKKAKKGKKKKRRPGISYTAASGTLTFETSSQSGTSPTTSFIGRCRSGPVSFSSTGAGPF